MENADAETFAGSITSKIAAIKGGVIENKFDAKRFVMEKKMSIMLRPHHMMCMHFYRGLGYSEDFTHNMDAVIDMLKTDPETKVRLVSSADNICSHCPNMNGDGICTSQEKVEKMDKAALRAFEFTNEKIAQKAVSYSVLQEQFNKNFSKETFEEVCSNCEWYIKGVCRYEE